MDYFDKTYHPPGTPPGTLVDGEKVKPEQFSIHLIDYTMTEFIEKELTNTRECQAYLEKDSITWIHLQGHVQVDTIKSIGNIFELHPLALEDVLNKGQRPKIEEYDDLLFIVMSMPSIVQEKTLIEQVSIFFDRNFIISFHSGNKFPFTPLRNRLRKAKDRIRHQKADYLLYSIVDLVIDQGYPVLESFGEYMEDIENDLLNTNNSRTILGEIYRLRRELLILRRNLWPQRDVLKYLLRNEDNLITEDVQVYLRDCYDHTVQILDILDNYREMAASLTDVYLSFSSHRLSEIIRVLTMIATIFIPLTFIVGLYGMNFTNRESPWAMPELNWYYGYPMVWLIMIGVVIGMLIYFKRKNWL